MLSRDSLIEVPGLVAGDMQIYCKKNGGPEALRLLLLFPPF